MKIKASDVIGLAVLGGIGYGVYKIYKLGGQVGEAFNPASEKNIVNRGVTAAGKAVTGDKYFTLGGWLYDITHPGEGEELTRSVTKAEIEAFRKAKEESQLFGVY